MPIKLLTHMVCIVAVATVSLPVTAEEAAPSLLQPEEVSQIAGQMFQSYQAGNVNGMLAAEDGCWKKAIRGKKIDKKLVATCTTAAMSGAFIEAAYARQQWRGAHPSYTGKAVRARLEQRTGFDDKQAEEILVDTVQANLGAMFAGLQGAGMP